ncbi:MAG: Mycothione reductase [Chlamydiae bacterium]|nr:Mycothione reductase [Chlamydiota bacterium]
MKNYDAIIIGGGAGLKIARPAADEGFHVAVIEEAQLGGTCLNRGCIPSKMLIHPADVLQQMRESDIYNINFDGKVHIDINKLVTYVSQTVDDESKSIYPLYEKHKNIDLYTCRTEFVDSYTLKVGNQLIKSSKIFIAAGARPYIPNIQGLEGSPYITSTELLRATKLPKSVAILGAGYIACELGHYLDAMGVKVHFILRSKFMRTLDDSIQEHFQKIFEKRFNVVKMNPEKVLYQNESFSIEGDGQTVEAQALLVAAGVLPNSDTLNLQKTGVDVDERGFIKVNEHLETSQSNIFAFGDIIGRNLFRHSANFEGEYLFEEHYKKRDQKQAVSYPPVPYGVFTWPQIGGVGKVERELKQEGTEYIVGLNAYQNSAMGMALQKEEGLVKLLFDAKTHKLLGGHVIGEQATTMCHMIIAYMNMEATLEDMLRTIYIHPALPEIIRNAARKAKASIK